MARSIHESIRGLTLDQLKQQAKHLRTSLAATGTTINHARSLELLAHQYGYKNWNVLHAAIGNRPPPPRSGAPVGLGAPVNLGDHVEGRYLNQPFAGEVIGVAKMGGDRFRVTFNFDEPVDVVTFDSFSAYRKRVTCTVDARGMTAEKTSDGQPHMQIRL